MGTKEKNKKGLSIAKVYLSKQILIILCIVAVVLVAWFGTRKVVSIDNKTTKLGFENIGELATQEAYCTEVNVTDESKQLFGIDIPFTQSKYIYSYDVNVKAGIDFDQIDWSVKDKTITVKVPKAKILSCEVNKDSFKVYHEQESIFTKITLKDNNEAMSKLKENAKKDAESNGLLENAEKNAKTIIKGFIEKVYDSSEYEIKFVEK